MTRRCSVMRIPFSTQSFSMRSMGVRYPFWRGDVHLLAG
jgi:hypothetical protein